MTETPPQALHALTAAVQSGMIGGGIMYTAMDVDEEHDPEFNAWYTHEHLHERLAMPGLLRARRYVRSAVGGPGQRYMTIYEARDAASFTSPEYLELLNTPSVWSQRMQPLLQSVGRTIMSVRYSAGPGIGRALAAIELSPVDPAGLLEAISTSLAPAVLRNPEITGVHLTAQDAGATHAKTTTREAKNLGRPDLITDWLLLIEGTGDVMGPAHDLIGDPAFRQPHGDAVVPTGYDYVVSLTTSNGMG